MLFIIRLLYVERSTKGKILERKNGAMESQSKPLFTLETLDCELFDLPLDYQLSKLPLT